ncbi:MAG: undecaprenyl-diphosphatase [Candidatus Azotimanducaceae bacterium]|jgi:undecaprenyl-diphosphatase
MGVFEAIALGVVQGLTEFLPVSSTGHLILARELFHVDDSYALAFDAILHLATAAAVIVYFWKDILVLINTALRKLSRLPVNQSDLTLLYAILIGTIPAVVLGLSFESMMESYFRHPLLVALVLIAGSIFFMYAEWVYMHNHQANDLTVKKGFKIGLFQSLALIPGMSRSGSTIAGAMLLGFTRSEAARFAFLLAVPVILGAGMKKLLELIVSDVGVEWTAVGVGAVTAFLTGLFAVHFMISFVRKHTLWPFIWYRIILAAFVIFVVLYG